jgi:hypothetical protein
MVFNLVFSVLCNLKMRGVTTRQSLFGPGSFHQKNKKTAGLPAAVFPDCFLLISRSAGLAVQEHTFSS